VSDIFISYADVDRHRVKPLVEALLHRGWSVWWDRVLLPGETWDRAIEGELAAARCVIVLWSRSSIQSDWVRTESEEAKKRGILVPALLDDVNIPLAFNRLQAANLVEWSGVLPCVGFDELAQGVSEVLSKPDSPAQTVASATTATTLEVQQRQGGAGLRWSGEESVTTKAGDRSEAGRASPEGAEHPGSIRKITLGAFALGVLALTAGITWYVSAGHPPIPHPDNNGPSGKTARRLADEHVENKGGEPGSKPPQEEEMDGKRLSTAKARKSPIPASETVNFKGAWTADVRYKLWDPEKTYRERFQFEILGDEVIGSASLMGIPRIISGGKVHGSNISFITKYPLSEGVQENQYRGSISGDAIQFIYQDPGDGVLIHFTAARVRP
jgi:hypothetical protein